MGEIPCRGQVASRDSHGRINIAKTRIDSVRVSCRSDKYAGPSKRYGGVVIWKPTSGMDRIKPGYFHIKDTSGQLPSSNEGQVHGRITKDLCQLEPSQVVPSLDLLSQMEKSRSRLVPATRGESILM